MIGVKCSGSLRKQIQGFSGRCRTSRQRARDYENKGERKGKLHCLLIARATRRGRWLPLRLQSFGYYQGNVVGGRRAGGKRVERVGYGFGNRLRRLRSVSPEHFDEPFLAELVIVG